MNSGCDPFDVAIGDKIAQIVFMPLVVMEIVPAVEPGSAHPKTTNWSWQLVFDAKKCGSAYGESVKLQERGARGISRY